MLVLVGNSPSSGSTLLADLLDSTPYTACGNELNFWSNKYLYDFPSFKKNPALFSNTAQLSVTGLFPHYKFLSGYGIEKNLWYKWISGSDSVPEFSQKFTHHYLSYRQKDMNGVVFEKSPENLTSVSEFLEAFPDSYFINIIRDPLYVYASCMKRGMGNYTAAMLWLIDGAMIRKVEAHPRFIQVHYESLVKEPFKTVSELIAQVSDRIIAPEEIQKGYENNIHKRSTGKKLKSWEVSSHGEVKNANLKKLSDGLISRFSAVRNYKISEAYAALFNLDTYRYAELAEHFGYEIPIDDTAEEVLMDWRDRRKLFTKALRYKKSINGISTFLHPTEQL